MNYRLEDALRRVPSRGRGCAYPNPRQAEPGGFSEKPSLCGCGEGGKILLISGADEPFGR